VAVPIQVKTRFGASLGRDALRRLAKNRLAVAGAVLLTLMTLAVVAGPWVSAHAFDTQDRANAFAAPSLSHPFGTDQLGRDVLVRVLSGGRVSLMVGLAATGVSILIGVAWGATAGFAGGRTDALLMRIVDVLYTLPFTVVAILLVTWFGKNIVLVFLAIGAVEWLTMARIVRGQVQSLRKSEFVEAARCMGFSPARVLAMHIVPNCLGPVIVYATLTVPKVMLVEAFLSYLGLGVQAPMSSWGSLIKEGVECMEEFPWLLMFPGIALTLTLFCLNFLGDGLRDALDPKGAKD
jgi:oligopeptide transport system permease protein